MFPYLSQNAQNMENTSFHIGKERLSALRYGEVLKYYFLIVSPAVNFFSEKHWNFSCLYHECGLFFCHMFRIYLILLQLFNFIEHWLQLGFGLSSYFTLSIIEFTVLFLHLFFSYPLKSRNLWHVHLY